MKKCLLVGLLGLLVLVGCATIKVESPQGQKIALQSDVDSQPLVKKTKVWYALYGLVPISPNSTAVIMQKNNLNLRKASFKAYFGFDDYLVGAFTGLLTIQPLTLEIYGVENRGGANE